MVKMSQSGIQVRSGLVPLSLRQKVMPWSGCCPQLYCWEKICFKPDTEAETEVDDMHDIDIQIGHRKKFFLLVIGCVVNMDQ